MIGLFQNTKLRTEFPSIKKEFLINAKTILNTKYKCKDAVLKVFVDGSKYLFDDIVVFDYPELVDFAKKLQASSKIEYLLTCEKHKRTKIDFNDLYKRFREKYGVWLTNKIDVTVCPYCNREYVNGDGKNFTCAEFDHFYPKSNEKYKCLALCISNLIPCCHSCNHLKSTKNLSNSYSPYNYKFSSDDMFTFEYDHDFENDMYFIDINEKETIIHDNIECFKIKERYSIHSNLIKDLKDKKMIWNKVLLEKIKEISHNSNINFENLYYGVNLTQDEYYLKPLSKFIHDILEQLNDD